MANQQLTVVEDPDLFLEFLLRCALTAPGAATSPTAGRILARLLVVGAIEGGDELVTPFLVPIPGEDAIFEVRAYHPGNLEPTEVRSGLGAAAALRIALRSARDGDDGIEVVSHTDSGLERCVMVRDSTGDFEFRFAGSETLNGHPAECAAARRAWTATLAEWRDWVAKEQPDLSEVRPVADRPHEQLGPGAAQEPVGAEDGGDDGDGSDDRGWRAIDPVAFADPDLAAPVVVAPAEPTPAWAPAPVVVAAPAEPTPAWAPPSRSSGRWANDDEPGERIPARPPPQRDPSFPVAAEEVDDDDPFLLLELDVDRAPEPGDRDARIAARMAAPAVPPAPAFDVAAVIDAIHDALANLTVTPDLSRVEEIIARAMAGDRNLVEPLARRLSIRLGESLARHDTHDLIDALLPLIPRPGEVAEAVTADVTALLSEVMLRRSSGAEGPGILGALEQLQVQVDGMRDQLRKSTGVLHSIDDRMEVSDRRAVAAERIGASIEQEMQRLALRVDEQVAALAATAGGGSELADGVARLTRKLRQSVAQLDRALVRLDEVVEHPAMEPVRNPAPG